MSKNKDVSKLFSFDDTSALRALSFKRSLNENLKVIRSAAQVRYPDITRISVWTYDEKSERLKSFLSTHGKNDPLAHQNPSMRELMSEDVPDSLMKDKGKRYIRHLENYADSDLIARLLESGFKSSYTAPIIDQGQFLGLIVLSSTRESRFDYKHIRIQVDFVVKLIALLVISEMYAIKGLQGTAQTLKDVASMRDNETGEHLERMSRFSRHIALRLADKFSLDDEYIEDLYRAAPLHDIGKIAIPDSILLKSGKLTDDEFEEMKKHAALGKDIIEKAIANLEIQEKPFSNILINIIHYHHENWDGSGYPMGLSQSDIPLEARIIRVADVYDALISSRPYKEAWSREKALAFIEEQAGSLFDPDCVAVLRELDAEFEEVITRFCESDF